MLLGHAGTGCPAAVRDAACEILYTAAISIRAAGNAGDANYCALEAGHVHNLPSLLKAYSPEKLRWYLEVEVPEYVEKLSTISASNPDAYAPMWRRLTDHLAMELPGHEV
jgi:hypothetical protein